MKKIGFDNVDRNYSTIGRKTFVQCPKTKKSRFFRERTFPQIFFWDFVAEWSIDDPGDKLLRRNRYILAHSPKMKERKFLIRKHFPQKFNGTSIMQFRQRRWKLIARSPKNFSSMCEKDKNFSQANSFFLYARMINRMQFWKPHGKSLQPNWKNSTHGPRSNEKKLNLLKKNCPTLR